MAYYGLLILIIRAYDILMACSWRTSMVYCLLNDKLMAFYDNLMVYYYALWPTHGLQL
jgi:hypothetical protein